MKILVVGSGGREHALAWRLSKDAEGHDLYCAPGNAGTAAIAKNVPIKAEDVEGIVYWAVENKPDLVVVGPEAPLVLGLVDALEAEGIKAFGPVAAGARMEGSKRFAKEVMFAAGVPTGRAEVFKDPVKAKAALAAGTLHVFSTDAFTVGGAKLDSYMADVDTDPAYTPDTEVIKDGYFHESEYRSAPYFDIQIDGITLLNMAF